MTLTRHIVKIPDSKSTVSVSIIDTTVRFQQWKIDPFIKEPKMPGHTNATMPSWSFKIAHPEKGTYIFDLGVRKDFKTKLPTRSLNVIEKNGWKLEMNKDVAQILSENGERLEDIKGIIWSHWHWDHVGDPQTFPNSVKLIVGPGFKDAMLPGFPENPEGSVASDAWKGGRELVEVKITKDLLIGNFPALDFFGDGSFYLLDSPGHTVGHLCALARTTPDSFIFMGGDVAHLIGQIRPTEHLPLPDNIMPNPQLPVHGHESSSFPCAGYVAIHPKQARDKPYYIGSEGMAIDPVAAEESTMKVEGFDGDDRVLTVIAHDDKLEDIIEVYPKEANQWKEKGWKRLAHWRFLGDFEPKDI